MLENQVRGRLAGGAVDIAIGGEWHCGSPLGSAGRRMHRPCGRCRVAIYFFSYQGLVLVAESQRTYGALFHP
jgi:hypothetical protein